jgi:eukaryotic-like serine/threonine-protein kinase
MAYCYECGSEIEQIEVFCPYCGISLKPFSGNDETNEVSNNEISEESAPLTESVSDIPEADAQKAVNENISEEKPDEISTVEREFAAADTDEKVSLPSEQTAKIQNQAQDTPPASLFSLTENDVIQEDASVSQSKPDDFNSIPTPAIIEDLESFTAVSEKKEELQSEPVSSAEPEDFNLVETSESIEDNEITEENVVAETENVVVATDDIFTGIEEHLLNEEIKAKDSFQLADTPDELKIENNSTENSAKVVETPTNHKLENSIPNIPFADEFSETIPGNFDVQKDSSDIEISPLTEAPLKVEAADIITDEPLTAAPVEDSIIKPAENLEEFEPAAPKVFDSVRIMESDESAANPPKIEPENIISPTAASGEVSAENSSEKENLSHTTPNIGVNDTDGKKAAKLKPLDEGTILNGRYEIVRKIGGGGMGAVYLASDNNLGGVLRAVKEMVQSYIEEAQQEKSINDFRRESMILSTLDHVSIPTIYDYFYDDKESRFYLVMKYINGGDLSGRLRAAPEGKIDEKTVTEWSIQIADVLDYLHNRPTTIVYRDLKPANIMIDGNSGRAMLIDFGIARSINKEEKGVTAVGTMGYAPPELFSGNVEPRSDIYSLGSTMFHLLTGADPQSNPLLIFDFQKNPRPRQINSLLSDQMERILMRAVEYNSTARFGSASEFKKVLEEHLENLKSGRVSYGVSEAPASLSLSNQIVFCGFCGQKIVASDMFCAFCGSKQPLSQQGVHAEIYTNAPQTAKLMIIGTNELESPVFNLEKEDNIVGRRDPQSGIFPEVDLSKFDPQTKISRRHARIWQHGENYMVEDLGSSNGTTVLPTISDAVRLLPHQPHILASGDKLRIGDTTLHFVKG